LEDIGFFAHLLVEENAHAIVCAQFLPQYVVAVKQKMLQKM
jgi:hypothetical protein